MIPYKFTDQRIIMNAWDKAVALKAAVGDAPPVNGLCPMKDSCDQCRVARKADARYMAYVYAKDFEAEGVIEFVRTFSHMESGMAGAGMTTDEEWDQFYKNFSERFGSLYRLSFAKVGKYLADYGKYLDSNRQFC